MEGYIEAGSLGNFVGAVQNTPHGTRYTVHSTHWFSVHSVCQHKNIRPDRSPILQLGVYGCYDGDGLLDKKAYQYQSITRLFARDRVVALVDPCLSHSSAKAVLLLRKKK